MGKYDTLRNVSFSQYDYTDTVGRNIADNYQDIINDRFSYATDFEVIQEQLANGGKTYKDVGVRVTSLINPTVGENYGDQYKKIIFQTYNYPKDLGYMYKFNGKTWLTVNTRTVTNLSGHSIVRMCNNTLKWVDKNDKSVLRSWDCVFTNHLSNSSFDYGAKEVIQVSGEMVVLVQRNAETNQITYNDRFIFDGKAFQVNQLQNHLSQTYLILKMFETQVQPEDDIVNNIANANTLNPSVNTQRILPDLLTIPVGSTQTYTIYNYINGEPNADTFTITASGLPAQNYTFTVINGNSFSIQALEASNLPLLVLCTNNNTAVETKRYITLTRGW